MSRPSQILSRIIFAAVVLSFCGCETIYRPGYSPRRSYFVPPPEKKETALAPMPTPASETVLPPPPSPLVPPPAPAPAPAPAPDAAAMPPAPSLPGL